MSVTITFSDEFINKRNGKSLDSKSQIDKQIGLFIYDRENPSGDFSKSLNYSQIAGSKHRIYHFRASQGERIFCQAAEDDPKSFYFITIDNNLHDDNRQLQSMDKEYQEVHPVPAPSEEAMEALAMEIDNNEYEETDSHPFNKWSESKLKRIFMQDEKELEKLTQDEQKRFEKDVELKVTFLKLIPNTDIWDKKKALLFNEDEQLVLDELIDYDGSDIDAFLKEYNNHLVIKPSSFKMIIEGKESLTKSISPYAAKSNTSWESLAMWRMHLDPSQEEIVSGNYKGPVLVEGGPGTGKTVLAIHRALALANTEVQKELEDGKKLKKILLLTYSNTLSGNIKDVLDKRVLQDIFREQADPEKYVENLLDRIEITTIDSLAKRLYEEYYKKSGISKSRVIFDSHKDDSPKEDSEVEKIWNEALQKNPPKNSDYDLNFFKNEWEYYVVEHCLFDAESYSQCKKRRDGKIQKEIKKLTDKKQIWPVIESYMDICERNGKADIHYAKQKLIDLIPEEGLYENIIVDEGQDLESVSYRLIRKLAGEEHKNDIFIVQDINQSIFPHPKVEFVSFLQSRKKSHRILEINYRTPETIRCAAEIVLKETKPDSSYPVSNSNELSFKSIHSKTKSDSQARGISSKEIDYVRDRIIELVEMGESLSDICVLVPSNRAAKIILDELPKKNSDKINQFLQLTPEQRDDRTKAGLRISTIHRIKGLEFKHIIICGANEKNCNSDVKKDQKTFTEEINNWRNLFYVAMTRAKNSALITATGNFAYVLTDCYNYYFANENTTSQE